MITRIPILAVTPQLEGGRFPAKSTVGESFPVQARIFGESRDVIGAAVVLTDPEGTPHQAIPMHHVGNDVWSADVIATHPGPWTFHIESWTDPYATWVRDATIKVEAGVDVDRTLADGAALLRRSGHEDPVFNHEVAALADSSADAVVRLIAGMSVAGYFEAEPIRNNLSSSKPLPLFVDRGRALFGSWYEFFPRSEGAVRNHDGTITAGTLQTALKRIDAVADMGFDVIYLPPIHPIGTVNRKGRNNAPTAQPGDPGSPWAIGSADGGHDAIDPGLGTIDDFDAFVAHARTRGIEIALDFALQCAPDHPWVSAHPEWFTTSVDGSIACAENPPETYTDIYRLNFDNDPEGLYTEILRVLQFWLDHDVMIFRVESAHTKPLGMWERLMAACRRVYPEVIFLADAFTARAMLQALAMVGFQQSYTYITWCEGKDETANYLVELAHETSHFLRPNLFVNSPDILPRQLQTGDEALFRSRAMLAATASPTWGMYAGYELLEHEPANADSDAYLNSEKHEIKVRDWEAPGSLAPFITRLNMVRRSHPALQQLRNLTIQRTDDNSVLCYSKRSGADAVIIVIDLAPSATKTVQLTIDPADLGLRVGDRYLLHDEISGQATSADRVTISRDHPARILAVVTP